ncbi:hypothetical protein A2368_02130 [Candidatus Collierbacteria bacterium RIFOXYB1_FULL_49_13]|uniref:inosine/xanthosine triphosphatase n=1 Tax=Candidatus Collierbacteria bacterium RIFOXYB1_FULL_49_13 TaxID=1817728 RepID=A0A1F5FG94_9BACT|nr:MAG: hypothetical protein A2368_02130 [Candidatus Collierbacteria bacterium RIFOXYB1_FULL_49_13]
MIIAAGTTSTQKLDFLEETIQEIGLQAKIIPIEVTSGVSDQPLSATETRAGSINRAQNSLTAQPMADLGLGIEVGYSLNKQGKYRIFCCVSIVDRHHRSVSCCSSFFLLPDFHQEIIKSGKHLGDHVRDYKKNTDHPVVNYTRDFIIHRKQIITEATRNALLQYFCRD